MTTEAQALRAAVMHRFDMTYCSQCGAELGPGNAGVSGCNDHVPAATEAAALAYLRSNLRTPDEIIAAVNAMCVGQDKEIAMHLQSCSDHISEEIPDPYAPGLDDPNNGRGEFDKQSGAVPAWMTRSVGM